MNGMIDPDLWGEESYPHVAGFKRTDTSWASAQTVDAKTLRGLTLQALRERSMTADEVAEYLGIDHLSIRPRCSELFKLGKIYDTKGRRPNRTSGKKAIVWGAIR